MKPGLLTVSLCLTALALVCQTFAILLPGWKYGRDRKGGLAYEKGIWYTCAGWNNCVYDITLDAIRTPDVSANTTATGRREDVYMVNPVAGRWTKV